MNVHTMFATDKAARQTDIKNICSLVHGSGKMKVGWNAKAFTVTGTCTHPDAILK